MLHSKTFRVLADRYAAEQRRFLQRPALNQTQRKEGRRTGALAMKVGMIPVWDKWGQRHATTVLQLDECKVVQVKTEDTDGYTAVQLGVGEAKRGRVRGTAMGHFKRWLGKNSDNVNSNNNKFTGKVNRTLQEFRVSPDALLEPGTVIEARHFVPGQLVDVCGTSKGKGFQGVMKRWNFKGGSASHGNSLAHRTMGSTGQCQDPGRTFKNKKMPGRMGGKRSTVQNLYLLKIDPERQLLYVKGGVPGPNGTFVRVVDAVKGPFSPSPPPLPTFFSAKEAEAVTSTAASKDVSVDTNEEYAAEGESTNAEDHDIFAPMPESDPGIIVEPDDPY